MTVGLAARGLMTWTVVLVSAGLAAAQSEAPSRQAETGREWLARCGAAPERGACLAWVEGLVDINEIYRGLGVLDKTPEGFCTPPTATVAEAAQAVARYLRDHSDALHFSARILAYMALRQTFPCSSRQ